MFSTRAATRRSAVRRRQGRTLYTPTDDDRAKARDARRRRASRSRGDEHRVAERLDHVTTRIPPGRASIRDRASGRRFADRFAAAAARNAGFGLGLIGLALIGIVPLSGRLTRNSSTCSRRRRPHREGDYRARVAVKSQRRDRPARRRVQRDGRRRRAAPDAAVEQERIRRELELGRRSSTRCCRTIRCVSV